MADELEVIKALKRTMDGHKDRLRQKRTDLLAQLAAVDAALVELGEAPKNRGGRPRRAAAAESAGDEAPAAVEVSATPLELAEPPENDRVAHELWELRGWFYTLPAAYRKPIEMRASGKTVGEIATMLRLDKTAISNIVFRQRQCLAAARQAGKKPEAAAPAADSEEEPDPAGWSKEDAAAHDSIELIAPAVIAGLLPIVAHVEEQPAVIVPEEPATSSQNIPHGSTDTSSFGASPVVEKEEVTRCCTACGKPGHRRPQCPDREAQELAMYADAVAPISQPVEIVIVPDPPPAPLEEPTEADLKLLMGPPTLVQLRRRPGHATVPPRSLTREEKRLSQVAYYPEVGRPLLWEHCGDMPRPCPFVSCSHHLYLDVDPKTGSIKFNFPDLEVWELTETCSLDVADRGGITLEAVAALLNLTRERIRQVEVRGLNKIRDDDTGAQLGVAPERASSPLGAVMG